VSPDEVNFSPGSWLDAKQGIFFSFVTSYTANCPGGDLSLGSWLDEKQGFFLP